MLNNNDDATASVPIIRIKNGRPEVSVIGIREEKNELKLDSWIQIRSIR